MRPEDFSHPFRDTQVRTLGRALRRHAFKAETVVRLMFGVGIIGAAAAPFVGLRGMSDWIVYGAGIAFFEGIFAFTLWRAGSTTVDLFEAGLVWTQRGTQIRMYWDDLDTLTSHVYRRVTNGVPGPKHEIHSLRDRNGQTIRLTHGLEDIEKLAATVREHLVTKRLPAVREAFARGEAQHFGLLHLDAAGIEVQSRRLAWLELTGFDVEDGKLTIRGVKPFTTIELKELPNYPLALMLLESKLSPLRAARN